MFRNPRETEVSVLSLGRPPTPPGTRAKTPFTLAVPPSVPAPKMAVKTRAAKQAPLPTIGRQGTVGSAKKVTATAKLKQNGKPNSSILSFFKKTDGPEDGGIFVPERGGTVHSVELEDDTPPPEVEDAVWEDVRFNESGGSVKRRKTSAESDAEDLVGEGAPAPGKTASETGAKGTSSRARSGPFIEESDSENEREPLDAILAVENTDTTVVPEVDLKDTESAEVSVRDLSPAAPVASLVEQAERPPLIKHETSYAPDPDETQDFEGMGDFDEDLFEQGDEFLEQRYMQEQAALEGDDDEKDYDPLPIEDDAIIKVEGTPDTTAAVDGGSSCPICSISLAGVDEQDAGAHVNNCLDGNPTPLPDMKPPAPKTAWPIAGQTTKQENAAFASQYKKPVRAPKPGQADPYHAGGPSANGGSAFNKLMSGHAEDAAWAEAAAAENASRGKPAYQRTCPFYKVMPGLFICVDAFRYGAVTGCKAYFLSHFHSDHYVGLTASWTHGPIYCSKVTGNLVRQQLRVDPKYVVDLDFDQTVDVPDTKGVKVTMIHANHCPGSSLYLFEKVIGKRTNGEPRLQRILHCGDFRACRAHIEHPLLMPDVQDKLTGKTREQKIDVCYLDTTYLNPKYAFPSQKDVITACADMCVSLSKHSVDESDGWEQMKRQRAGEGMAKFVRKESATSIKEEPPEDDEDVKLLANPAASQQVLSTSTTPSVKQGRGRLLVIVGTYSIGKERICLGIARALNSKIYAPPTKMRIVAALEDPELNALMTPDPRAAQVHMTPLFEIRADTLDDYLKDYFPHFTRAVGFRPSGWNYRPPTSRFLESPSVNTVLNGENWKSAYGMKDLVPQRGSTSRSSCFGVPYSEHSSFRELTMFCCALRIERVIPTVNVGSAKGREKMKGWCERWAIERKKNGVWKLPEDGSW
ncbi:DNA cross-link repair protein PSO2/SNM1 [Teratosphaeriaceae sp. CCFEE 6253]|nr:DNA cross-link repair protein PSO2/SNM1 [Teratosphaeriaceae sp. CCFEE 6253]